MSGTFWGFAAIIALIVILLIRLFKSKTQNQNASNASDETNASEPHYHPDNVGATIKEYLDPYDQSPLLSDAQLVTIRMNGKNLSFKTNSRNVSRVKRHGLPLKNRSFVRGNNYYLSYTDNSSNYYDDGDNGLDWWDIYWLYNALTDDTNYQPIYGDNNFVGYGDGQTAGGGVDGEYNTIDGQQNDVSQQDQNFDPSNIEPAIILNSDDGTTIIGSERDSTTDYQTNYQDNDQQSNQNNDAENVGNFS